MNIHKQTFGLSGRYHAVVKRNGIIVRDGGWTDNLITDAGLDYPATQLFANCFTYGRAGSGVGPATFASTALSAQLAGGYGVTNLYSSGSTNFDPVSRQYVIQRTFEFDTNVGPGNLSVNEVGTSPGAASNLFSYVAPLAIGLTIYPGENLSLTYQLTITLSAQSAVGDVITNPDGGAFNSSGVKGFQKVGLALIQGDGVTSVIGGYDSGVWCNEPAINGTNARFFMHSDNVALATIGSTVLRTLVGIPVNSAFNSAYTPGDRYRDLYGTFSSTNGPNTTVRGFGIGPSLFSWQNGGFDQVFNNNQSKDNVRSLKLVVRRAWDRV